MILGPGEWVAVKVIAYDPGFKSRFASSESENRASFGLELLKNRPIWLLGRVFLSLITDPLRPRKGSLYGQEERPRRIALGHLVWGGDRKGKRIADQKTKVTFFLNRINFSLENLE